jgi:hypothetical protein
MGSGASRDFGPAKTRSRIEGPEPENPKCLNFKPVLIADESDPTRLSD